MWLQLGVVELWGEQPLLPKQAQFPQTKASGGLGDCEKVPQEMRARSSWAPSEDKDQPPGAQGGCKAGPAGPLPRWVIATRCPAADVTLQG